MQRERVIKLSSLSTPLAWKSGEPFGILVEASADNFSMVGSAYLDGVLELDDGLLVDQIVSKYLARKLKWGNQFSSDPQCITVALVAILDIKHGWKFFVVAVVVVVFFFNIEIYNLYLDTWHDT